MAMYKYLRGLSFITIAAFFCAALFSYSPVDPSLSTATDAQATNLLGIVGSYTADLLLSIFGFAAYLFILFPFVWGMQYLITKEITYFWLRFSLALISIVLLSSVLARYSDSSTSPSYGGAVSTIINIYTVAFNSTYTLLVEISLLVFCMYVTLNISIKSVGIFIYKTALAVAATCSFIVAKATPIYRTIKMMALKLIQGNDDPLLELHMQEKSVVAKVMPASSAVRPAIKEVKQQATSTKFNLPDTDLLNPLKKQKASTMSEKFFQSKAEELIQILRDFGVSGAIKSYSPGPVVTLYEFEPAAGIKSSKIIGLADDIARTMRAMSTRIAVIPGKNSLGIELPNETREMVYLRETIESTEYKNGQPKLPLVLGKDISGNTVVADLAQMPHLLVAGTTGSGKSVAINTMILSLLFRYTPEECKFVMIDPKMLELSVYQGIPHLLAPVVTEPGKAVVALKWTVKEMENRYRLMSHLNVRNIEGFNQMIDQASTKNIELTKKIQTGFDPGTGKPIFETIEVKKQKLPFIVVIVDEMADLMIVAGKEIESLVQRLAQMARAAGIHIIMATQRPSVDVITGVIKANFPTRVSFHVTSKIDSRTILGEMGAEQLLGKGDMLYMSGGSKIRRVHGPFVADSEVESVVSFLKAQATPSYAVDITSDVSTLDNLSVGEKDELYDQAVAVVIQEKKASTSFIQRYFKIGYNRAATIMDQMEKSGVVSSSNHVGKREILVEQ